MRQPTTAQRPQAAPRPAAPARPTHPPAAPQPATPLVPVALERTPRWHHLVPAGARNLLATWGWWQNPVPLKPSEWLILHLGIALLLPLMVLLLTNVNLVLTLTAVVLGILGPLGYLAVKATMRTRKFLAQLPDTLQLLSGSLSAARCAASAS